MFFQTKDRQGCHETTGTGEEKAFSAKRNLLKGEEKAYYETNYPPGADEKLKVRNKLLRINRTNYFVLCSPCVHPRNSSERNPTRWGTLRNERHRRFSRKDAKAQKSSNRITGNELAASNNAIESRTLVASLMHECRRPDREVPQPTWPK